VLEGVHCTETMERWVPEGIEKVGRASARGYMERGTGEGLSTNVRSAGHYRWVRTVGKGPQSPP
jgi:hypothetical protein